MPTNNICIAHGGDISIPCGGTNRVIAFSKSLRENGFNVHLVVPKPKNKFPEDLKNIKIHMVPFKERGIINQIPRAIAMSLKAKKIAKTIDGKLIIVHATLAGFANLMGCTNFILDMHDLSFDDPQYANLPFSTNVKKFIYYIEKRAVKYASRIITVSNPMKEFIIDEWNVPEGKIEVIPNGYFESKLNNIKIEEISGRISFLGSFNQKVDINKIINLAKSLKNAENIKIYMIGDGPLRNKLENKTKEYGLKNIIFIGKLPYEEALRFIAKSEITILPLLPHGTEVSCPVKIFDYAALGKAIVADDISEVCKIFKENNAALVSDPSDQKKFIDNVRVLLENETLRRKLSFNAKKLVKDFSWEKQAEKFVNVIEEIT